MDIEIDFIPREDYVDRIAEESGVPVRDLLLGCGGEYELLFTADKGMLRKIYDAEVPFHIIGMVDDSGHPELLADGKRSRIGNGRY